MCVCHMFIKVLTNLTYLRTFTNNANDFSRIEYLQPFINCQPPVLLNVILKSFFSFVPTDLSYIVLTFMFHFICKLLVTFSKQKNCDSIACCIDCESNTNVLCEGPALTGVIGALRCSRVDRYNKAATYLQLRGCSIFND